MINGDTESCSDWLAYPLGTKGAGALKKTGVVTTKTAVQKSVTAVSNSMQSPRLAQLLPYGRHTQVAMLEACP